MTDLGFDCPYCGGHLPMRGRIAGGLTRQQATTLAFIAKSVVDGRPAPSVREIAAGTGRNSRSSVHDQVAELVRLGYLRRHPRGRRHVQVTDKTWDFYAAREAQHAS
jgi:SOS-response transcriptional repressor LexA